MKLQLKRSSTLVSGAAKPPLASQLDYGELAINFNTTDPQLFFKDSANNVVSITDQFLPLAGGILTGDLVLSGDPTTALMPATKQYTDNAITTLSNSIVYPVTSVNGGTGAVSLNYVSVGAPSVTGANATGTWGIGISGNSATTTKWATARSVTFSGDVSGSFSIDGSANETVTMTVADDSHNHVISNVDGLQAALNAKQDSSSAIANSLALNGKADTAFVQTTNNSTLNSDSRNTRGPTRLFRSDNNSDYSVQTDWTGSRWRLRGYQASDVFHAGCEVAYADTSGSTANATDATNATNINVAADNSGNANHYVIFTDAATGNQRPKSDTSLVYNSSTNTLTVSNFAGTATNATNFNVAADNSTNSDHYVIFTNGTTGNQRPNSDSALKYNPSSNTLTVGTVSGTTTNVKVSNPTPQYTHFITFAEGYNSNSLALKGDQHLYYQPSDDTLGCKNLQCSEYLRFTANNATACKMRSASNHAIDIEVGTSSNNSYIGLKQSTTYRAHIRWDNNGTVGFGNLSGSWLAYSDSSGNWTATGDVTAYSDRALKTAIEPITEALDKVDQISGVTFERIDLNPGVRHAGVIAQDVQKVLPEVVREDSEGKLTVAYGNIVGLLVEAIKELRQEVKELKGE